MAIIGPLTAGWLAEFAGAVPASPIYDVAQALERQRIPEPPDAAAVNLAGDVSVLEAELDAMREAAKRGDLHGLVEHDFAFQPGPTGKMPEANAFAVLGGGILAAMGIIAGIWADKFDQLAAFQNFLIMPLFFLSGALFILGLLFFYYAVKAGDWHVLHHW